MPKIKVAENGPLLLSGADSVTRFPDGKSYAVEGNAALCRCGGSQNKPFCDGTHAKIGFTGDKDSDRVPDKREDYAASGITVHDNRGLCAHAGKCTDGLPSVFRLREEPFVDPEAASSDEIAGTIKQCPSGALSYSIAGAEDSEWGGDAVVAFVAGGPYVIKGGAELENAELLEGGTTDHFVLCRCGKSQSKPFCSGAHWNVQFDEDAPKRS